MESNSFTPAQTWARNCRLCPSADRPGLGGGETSEFKVTLSNHHLAPGRYYCHIAIGQGHPSSGYTDYDVVLDTLPFEILPAAESCGTHGTWYTDWGRIIYPELLFDPQVSKGGRKRF